MDVDPLSDTVPPRHAVESDDEDEFNPLSSRSVRHDLQVEIIGSVTPSDRLIVAAGDAGRVWARGAELGQQIGMVAVNKKQVGLLFKPSWTDATVLISEVTVRLPIWAMHGYGDYILDHLKPSRLVMLDSYSLPGYVGSDYTPLHQAPTRYLSTLENTRPPRGIQPFSSPNLVQSTSASFISLVSIQAISAPPTDIQATLFLLPSPHLPTRPPDDILPDATRPMDDTNIWSSELLQLAHSSMIELAGGEATQWKYAGKGLPMSSPSSKNRVEGNMYI